MSDETIKNPPPTPTAPPVPPAPPETDTEAMHKKACADFQPDHPFIQEGFDVSLYVESNKSNGEFVINRKGSTHPNCEQVSSKK